MRYSLFLSGALLCAASLYAPIGEIVEAQWQDFASIDVDDVVDDETTSSLPGITLTGKPNWAQAQHLNTFKGIRCAHFGIHADDAIGQDLGIDLFIATGARKKKGQHNLKVSIIQQERGSSITVYDKNNMVITGEVPMVNKKGETRLVPLLPWRDGMTIFYSVLLQTIEGKPHVVVVQHTRSKVLEKGQYYRPDAVADMLDEYHNHPVLNDRQYGFIDELDHMRALPLPHQHASYQFPLADDVYVTWAATKGSVRVMKR